MIPAFKRPGYPQLKFRVDRKIQRALLDLGTHAGSVNDKPAYVALQEEAKRRDW
jgi:hypothetical protein